MKQTLSICLFVMACLCCATTAKAQSNKSNQPAVLKTYLIERDIPGAGNFTDTDLKGISQKSCGVLKEMGTGIVWLQSYVTGNKIYCVYQAENEN
ncbi:MAG: DUF4242 domain-containing protein, partial [Ferruginibacter sp.]